MVARTLYLAATVLTARQETMQLSHLSLSCNAVNMFLQRRTTSGRNRLTVKCDAKLPLTSDSGTSLSLPPSLTKVIVRVLSEGIGGINCGLIVKSPETRVPGSGRKAGETVVPRAGCGFQRGDRISKRGSGSASTRLAVVCWLPRLPHKRCKYGVDVTELPRPFRRTYPKYFLFKLQLQFTEEFFFIFLLTLFSTAHLTVHRQVTKDVLQLLTNISCSPCTQLTEQ